MSLRLFRLFEIGLAEVGIVSAPVEVVPQIDEFNSKLFIVIRGE